MSDCLVTMTACAQGTRTLGIQAQVTRGASASTRQIRGSARLPARTTAPTGRAACRRAARRPLGRITRQKRQAEDYGRDTEKYKEPMDQALGDVRRAYHSRQPVL